MNIEHVVVEKIEELCVKYQQKENFMQYLTQTLTALEMNEDIEERDDLTTENSKVVDTYISNLEEQLHLESLK